MTDTDSPQVPVMCISFYDTIVPIMFARRSAELDSAVIDLRETCI